MKTKTKSFFSRFLKNSAIFFVGSIFSKLVSFLMLPLYTSKIPTEQMGVFDTNVTIMTIVASLCYFEIWTGVLRFLYAKTTDEEKEDIISSALHIFLISTFLFIGIALLICFLIGYSYPFLLVAYMFLYMLSNLLSFIARGSNRNVDFAVSGCICSIITVSLNVLLIVAYQFDYSALYISQIAGFTIQCIYLILRDKDKTVLGALFKQSTLKKKLFFFCIPLCINTAAYWCLTGLNRIIFNTLYGNEASGIFAIGSRFSSIVILVTTCFAYAWQDLSFSSTEDKNNSKDQISALYSNGSVLYFKFLFASMALILPLLKVIFPVFINSTYGEAINLIPLFIIVSLLSGFSSFLGGTFYAIKETKSVFITTIIGVIVNVGLAFPLIIAFGPNGANISTISAFLVMIIIRVCILKKKIGFDFKIYLLLIFGAWSLLTWFIYTYFGVIENITFIFMSMPFVIYLFRKELKLIKNNR